MADQTELFPELPPSTGPVVKLKRLVRPVWTEHKAKLIARYLRYFVFITKHGTYIDGFAGPQREQDPGAIDMWSARLVLENEPRWLRKFFLYDIEKTQSESLHRLKEAAERTDARLRKDGVRVPKRSYSVEAGDFNVLVDDLLGSEEIRPQDATFALLDQRSMECQWSTVQKLAHHCPAPERKIEQFYFLATGWIDRTISAYKQTDQISNWWGGDSWQQFRGSTGPIWANEFVRRFKEELNYQHAMAWPIKEKVRGQGKTMYYMIHATDHPEAPKLMYRAYNKVLEPAETAEQLEFSLGSASEKNRHQSP